MLDHLLLDDEDVPFQPGTAHKDAFEGFLPQPQAPAKDILSGKMDTARWLADQDASEGPPADPALAARLAREAFQAAVDPAISEESARNRAVALRVPEAVAHLTGMLSLYDWDFVEKAKQLRVYVVTKLMELAESSTDANKLKALKLLGDVTEVGLFTQRVEINNRNLTDEQINAEIEKRLAALTVDMPPADEIRPELGLLEGENHGHLGQE